MIYHERSALKQFLILLFGVLIIALYCSENLAPTHDFTGTAQDDLPKTEKIAKDDAPFQKSNVFFKTYNADKFYPLWAYWDTRFERITVRFYVNILLNNLIAESITKCQTRRITAHYFFTHRK